MLALVGQMVTPDRIGEQNFGIGMDDDDGLS